MRTLPTAPVLLLVAAGGAAGCNGVTREALCEKICDCRGCSTVESQRCEADVDKSEKLAADQKCDEAWSALASCAADQLGCTHDEIDASACAPEVSALAACTSARPIPTPFGGGPCDMIIGDLRACCNQSSSPAVRDACLSSVDALVNAQLTDDVCKALADTFVCTIH